jgi:hypothetical protein
VTRVGLAVGSLVLTVVLAMTERAISQIGRNAALARGETAALLEVIEHVEQQQRSAPPAE